LMIVVSGMGAGESVVVDTAVIVAMAGLSFAGLEAAMTGSSRRWGDGSPGDWVPEANDDGMGVGSEIGGGIST
jgi:hypothetical protein